MNQSEALARIVAALDRMAPPAVPVPDWAACPAYQVTADGVHGVAELVAPPPALLRGIDRQKAQVTANVARHDVEARNMEKITASAPTG